MIGGMIVVDLVNQTARNLSTDAVSGNTPRSRGGMMYIDEVGSHGMIVQIGGNYQNVTNTTDITLAGLENLVSQRLTVQDLNKYG